MILDEDQVLIEKILAGDKSSFEELMRKYNKKIYGFILYLVKDKEAAIELTQDFFLKLYRVLGKYTHQNKFQTWALRICYNMAIDYLRRKRRVKIDSLDNGDSITPSIIIQSEAYVKEHGIDGLIEEELNRYVWEMVDSLPVKYKELILLKYQQQLKYEEIAKILDLPLGTTKSRLFKAVEKLKAEIDKDGMFNE